MKSQKSKIQSINNSGFTILELSVVLAILSALASISIPLVVDTIKLSRIDEVKSILNNSLADCFQSIRTGKTLSELSPSSSVISDKRISSLGYKLKSTDNTCSSFFVTPTNSDEKILYELGFTLVEDVSTGEFKSTRFAFPTGPKSISSCENWGGINCSASQSLLDQIAAEKKLAEDRANCNSAFYEWLETNPSGPNPADAKKWTDPNGPCDGNTYAFEGREVYTEEAYNRELDLKYAQECRNDKQDLINNKKTGAFPLQRCGGTTFYFCDGVQKASQADIQACEDLKKSNECQQDLDQKIANQDPDGSWLPPHSPGPGVCADSIWLCNGKKHLSLADYEANNDCKQGPPPPQETCPAGCGKNPVPGYCGEGGHGTINGHIVCGNYPASCPRFDCY